ncbi:uncharacterized protein ACOB8E_002021 [Sarcophilus harrisii]
MKRLSCSKQDATAVRPRLEHPWSTLRSACPVTRAQGGYCGWALRTSLRQARRAADLGAAPRLSFASARPPARSPPPPSSLSVPLLLPHAAFKQPLHGRAEPMCASVTHIHTHSHIHTLAHPALPRLHRHTRVHLHPQPHLHPHPHLHLHLHPHADPLEHTNQSLHVYPFSADSAPDGRLPTAGSTAAGPPTAAAAASSTRAPAAAPAAASLRDPAAPASAAASAAPTAPAAASRAAPTALAAAFSAASRSLPRTQLHGIHGTLNI